MSGLIALYTIEGSIQQQIGRVLGISHSNEVAETLGYEYNHGVTKIGNHGIRYACIICRKDNNNHIYLYYINA